MNKEQFLALVDKELDSIKDIIRRKNADYTGDGGPFANFEDTGGMCSPLVGLLLRMGDKMQRLRTYAKKGELKVVGEGAEDAARDMIGYSLILLGMLEEAKPKIPEKRPDALTEELAERAAVKTPLRLEVGKHYRRRDGKVVKIVRERDSDAAYKYADDLGRAYTETGQWITATFSPLDLIEEVK